MNWLYYLLEANLYLAVFYGFYRLLLHKETFYSLNRYYLISATLFAFVLPLLQVGYLNELLNNNSRQLIHENQAIGEAGKSYLSPLNQLIVWGYLLIVSGLLMRLVYNLYGILSLAAIAKKQRKGNIILIDLHNSATAFSFFNMLFINPSIKEKNAILTHEMVHISQNHSLDILFFELIQILNWFNPLTWMMQKDIKLVHEYIADDITTISDIPKHDYAMLLIHNSFAGTSGQLTNQIFNKSILKKRINMLNQKKSAGRARLRLLLTVPVAGAMLCASTLAFSKDYALVDLYPEIKTDTSKKAQVISSPRIVVKGQPEAKKVVKQARIKVPPPPPPPPVEKQSPTVKKDQIKFPPPIVKKVPRNGPVKFPPPIVKKAVKQDQVVKFPPPVVKKDEVPPPPPVEPASPLKKSE